MRLLESLSLRLEQPPVSWIYRFALGYAFFPLVEKLHGRGTASWILVGWFVFILFALRVGPAVIRRALPFSREAQQQWGKQRQLAKRYDSYQWQKLFWIGLGMSAYLAVSKQWTSAYVALAAFCVLGGIAGIFVWVKVAPPPQLPRAEKPQPQRV